MINLILTILFAAIMVFLMIIGALIEGKTTELRLKDNAIKCNEAYYHPQTGKLIFSDNAMIFLYGVVTNSESIK